MQSQEETLESCGRGYAEMKEGEKGARLNES